MVYNIMLPKAFVFLLPVCFFLLSTIWSDTFFLSVILQQSSLHKTISKAEP